MEYVVQQTGSINEFDSQAWAGIATHLGIELELKEQLEANYQDEEALYRLLKSACEQILPILYHQIDRQVKLLQSDVWIEVEIANREDHIRIEQMLLDGTIPKEHWSRPDFIPEGIKPASWQEF